MTVEDLTPAVIGGDSVTAADTYANIDPATGKSLGAVARCGATEVDRAVAAAARAQRGWARTAPEERSMVLHRWAGLVDRDAEELARLESQDTGKPLSQARTDAQVCARYLRFYGSAIDSYYGLTIPKGPDLHVYTRREPYGVVASILAWNYPMQLFSRTVAAGIATGNAVVVKPADETPRTAVHMARTALEAGIPPGVVNVVTGLGPEAGAALAAHPGVAHLGFVGSTQVGSLIAHAAADRVVPTVLELGGKSAQVIFPDADLEAAVPAVVGAILQNAGQTCSAGSRLLVHQDVHDEVVERVAARFATVTMGRGEDDHELGPLVSRTQQERVRGFVEEVPTDRVITGGRLLQPNPGGGAFWPPTIVQDVEPTSRIAQEEVFGPVLATMRFADDAEALALANSTDYGLLGAVWTRDLSRAHRMAADIRAGQVFVNTYGAGGGVELPFGGWDRSGYGREKGVEALDAYTQTKTVVVRL